VPLIESRIAPGTVSTIRSFLKSRQALAALFLALASLIGGQPSVSAYGVPKMFHHVAPYIPTPLDVAQRMLEVAKVGPKDLVYDLGSGDGRIVILAAQKFGARAVGIEIDSTLCEKSEAQVAKLGLQDKVQIQNDDVFNAYLRPATVVCIYLLTAMNAELRPTLDRDLRPGTRIVTQEFQVPGWVPDKVVRMKGADGNNYIIFLYIHP
jgi:protein-L-isoaspartate O-methyltransferase